MHLTGTLAISPRNGRNDIFSSAVLRDWLHTKLNKKVIKKTSTFISVLTLFAIYSILLLFPQKRYLNAGSCEICIGVKEKNAQNINGIFVIRFTVKNTTIYYTYDVYTN